MRRTIFARLSYVVILAIAACSSAKSSTPDTGAVLTITATSLPSGNVGTSYTAQLASTGGTSPISWSLSGNSSLPPGLTLDSATGSIGGVPTAIGTYEFTVVATDSAAPPHTGTASLSITIQAATVLSVTTTNLPAGVVGISYSAQLASSGGTSPISWSLSFGSTLPPGLTLDPATGSITGTPSSAGTYDFTIVATDSAASPQTATASLSINIALPVLWVTTTSLPDARVGSTYSATLAATGGVQPYSWSLTGGSLPSGVTLAADGTLSGTPSVSGDYSVTLQVTDSSSSPQTATSTLILRVLDAAGGPELWMVSLPGAALDSAYSVTLVAAGGTTPYVWSVGSGALPPGLSLDATGTLSGTATTAGTYTFVVQVTDSSTAAKTAQRQYTIVVFTAPITITTVSLPNGVIGDPYDDAVAVNGGVAPYSWSVSAGSLPAGLALDAGTGAVTGTPTGAGTYTFTIQAADSSNPVKTGSQQFKVSIASSSNALNITTTGFPDGVMGVPYSAMVTALGGTPPYSWSSSGALPSGLTLDSATGIIAGTPTALGKSNFTIQVTDSSTPAKNFSTPSKINTYAPLQVTLGGDGSMHLPTGHQDLSYRTTIAVEGGLPSYRFALAAGSLPPGLSLNADGSVTGSPTALGEWGFSVQVTDSANPKQTISFNCWIWIDVGVVVEPLTPPAR